MYELSQVDYFGLIFYILTNFFSLLLSVTEKGMLKSPAMIMYLSSSYALYWYY